MLFKKNMLSSEFISELERLRQENTALRDAFKHYRQFVSELQSDNTWQAETNDSSLRQYIREVLEYLYQDAEAALATKPDPTE